MDNIFDIVKLDYNLTEANRLSVGFICNKGYGKKVTEALKPIKDYSPKLRADIIDIDLHLSTALSSLLSAFNNDGNFPIIVLGASLFINDYSLPIGVSTGGILGDPFKEIESASGKPDTLREGFSQISLPGGPGFAALSSTENLKRAFDKIRKLKGAALINKASYSSIFNYYNIKYGLIVFDGTGNDKLPLVVAVDNGNIII